MSQANAGVVKMWSTPLDAAGNPEISIHYQSTKEVSSGNFSVGDWVVVKYDDVLYPGEIVSKRGNDTEVSVMVPATKTTWKWPLKPDKIFYQPENIVKKITGPEAPCAVQGRLQFTFPEFQRDDL